MSKHVIRGRPSATEQALRAAGLPAASASDAPPLDPECAAGRHENCIVHHGGACSCRCHHDLISEEGR